MVENWKVIPDYPKYSVSDLGRVRRFRIKKNFYTRKGYEAVGLRDNGKNHCQFIHILVLSTFKPNPQPDFYNCVDHINRNPKDNRLINLRWSNASLNRLNSNAKGFSFNKHRNKYQARIKINGKQKYLGSFISYVNARNAYLEAKREALKELDPDQKYDV